MTPERECVTCGYPALRPDGHAPWCERVAAWLAALPTPLDIANAARKKKAAAA